MADSFEYLFTHDNGVKFRKADVCDLQDLISLKNESWFGTHRISMLNTVNQMKWLENMSGEDVHTPRNVVLIAAVASPVIDSGHNINIGVFKVLSIDWQNRLAEVGWDIYKEFRGKGFGKNLVKAGVDFCFKLLNLHRLNADILVTNTASQKCADAAEFKREGVQSKMIWRDEGWIDNLVYGIVKN